MFSARQGFFFQPDAPAGGFGNNARFPGNVGQYLSVNSATNLITWRATTGFTIEYWIRLVAYPGTINPGPGNQDTSGTNYWSFGPAESGRLEFYFWSPGLTYLRTNTGVMNLNNWYNVCAVFTTSGSNTTGSLYINGVRQQVQLNNSTYADSQNITGGVVSTGTPFRMGQYGANRWNAYMDNLRVSNTNRYSGASYTLATSPFSSDSNTQLLMICDGANGSTTFTDSSSFARAVTNFNNVVTVSNTFPNHS